MNANDKHKTPLCQHPGRLFAPKEEQRAPMPPLSNPSEPFASFLDAVKQAATIAECVALIQAKITSGELMVVKTVGPTESCCRVDCPRQNYQDNTVPFCSGCASRITK